jgi:hypothetical protein
VSGEGHGEGTAGEGLVLGRKRGPVNIKDRKSKLIRETTTTLVKLRFLYFSSEKKEEIDRGKGI